MARSFPKSLCSVAVAIATVGAASSALAVDGEWHVGGRVGVATLTGRSLGPALDLHGAYELNDMFDVVVQATGSRHDGSAGTDVLSASAGIAYKIDVFEWIPYVGLQGGYYHYATSHPAGTESGGEAGKSLHVGLDYLAQRSLAFGADFGWHGPLTDAFSFPYFTALVGAEYRFGW